MPTNHSPFATAFDAEAARHASLTCTLRRVRLRRRTRRIVFTAAAFTLTAVPLWLLSLRVARPGSTVPENPFVIHTRPLTAAQTVRSLPKPDIFIRTPVKPDLTVRITTRPKTAVPRLADTDFQQLLAAHEVGSIQVAGEPTELVFQQRSEGRQ